MKADTELPSLPVVRIRPADSERGFVRLSDVCKQLLPLTVKCMRHALFLIGLLADVPATAAAAAATGHGRHLQPTTSLKSFLFHKVFSSILLLFVLVIPKPRN